MMEEEEERRVNKNRREDRKLLESSRSYYDTPDHHSRKAQSSPSHVVGPHHQRRVSYDRTYDNVVVATIFPLLLRWQKRKLAHRLSCPVSKSSHLVGATGSQRFDGV